MATLIAAHAFSLGANLVTTLQGRRAQPGELVLALLRDCESSGLDLPPAADPLYAIQIC